MDLGLNGKVAMISGASRGIGKAIALGLAREGCRISICARGREALDDTADEVRRRGGEVCASVLDVTNATGLPRWLEETQRRFEWVDILVNNVGGGAARRKPGCVER